MIALKRVILALAVVSSLFMFSCSRNVALYRQALKEYKQGNFEVSLQSNVQSLMLKPTYVNAQNLIKKTYPTAIAGRESKIRKIQEANPDNMWDLLTQEYSALIDIQNLIKPINPLFNPKTGDTFNFELKDYEEKLASSKSGAAEYHYSLGIALSQSSANPDIQRQAAVEFRTALTFVPNYEDAAARYESARRLAVKRIAILAFEDRSGARTRYGSLIDLLTDSIISMLVQDKSIQEFMEIVTRDQMNALLMEQQFNPTGSPDEWNTSSLGNALGVHEILTGKLIQINYVPPRIVSTEYKETKNIVLGTEKYIDDNGKEKTREIKGDVTCNYKKYTKTCSVKIIASFSMIEVLSGKVKLQDTVNSDYTWTDTWARIISGDERALSETTLALINKEEPFPPSEVDMVNYALNLLSEEIVAKVKIYLSE